jgi:hypothetical protein
MRKSYDFSRAMKNPYAKRLQRQLAVAPITKNKEENRIAIGISCSNCSGIDAAKVYEFLANQSSDYEAYRLRLRPGLAAALDFYLVLNSAAAVASIARFLWMAYERLIAPKKQRPNDDAGIYIVIRGPDQTLVPMWLGKDVQTQAAFERRFELMVGQAQDPEWRAVQNETIEEIQDAESWVRISARKEPKTNSAPGRTTRRREYQR